VHGLSFLTFLLISPFLPSPMSANRRFFSFFLFFFPPSFIFCQPSFSSPALFSSFRFLNSSNTPFLAGSYQGDCARFEPSLRVSPFLTPCFPFLEASLDSAHQHPFAMRFLKPTHLRIRLSLLWRFFFISFLFPDGPAFAIYHYFFCRYKMF